MTPREVEFDAEGTTLRGWFYPTPAAANGPIIVMSHGFSGTADLLLHQYAERFHEAGFAVLIYDHRNTGRSEGTPRQEIDPWEQIRDTKHAVTFAATLPGVDPEAIGLWGTSYSGGHALVVGATDRRIKCVVSQVPTISGHLSSLRRISGDRAEALIGDFNTDREARFRGLPPAMIPVVSTDPTERVAMPGRSGSDFFHGHETFAPTWRNEVTLRSVEYAREYEPGIYIARVSPTPLLMIVAMQDYVTPTDLCLEAYGRALEPKNLVRLKGGHFAPYREEFRTSCDAARDWFLQHLSND